MVAIHHLVRIAAPATKVFVALTDNREIEAWFTDTRCKSWRLGSDVAWFQGETRMTISDFRPGSRVAFDVHSGSGWEQTQIVFDIEQLDATHALVRFDHTGWAAPTDHFRDCSVSWAYFLESLRLYLETGKGTPESVAPACEAGNA